MCSRASQTGRIGLKSVNSVLCLILEYPGHCDLASELVTSQSRDLALHLHQVTKRPVIMCDSDIVPEDHVALVLFEDEGSEFYLQIPLTIIRAVCLKPLKYLLYLGWCILGAEGVLSLQCDESDDPDEIDTDEDVVGGMVYYYIAAEALGTFLSLSCVDAGHLQHVIYLSTEDFNQVVDLDVIKAKSKTPSESSETRDGFRDDLAVRDVRCVWTGSTIVDGLHLIPFKRGSEVRSATFCREGSDCLPSPNSVVPADRGESSILRRGCGNARGYQ